MLATTILDYVRTAPFRPFRLHLNSGRAYEIRHPEMIRVAMDLVVFFDADPPDGPAQHFEILALDLIERLEPLAVASPAGGNGAG
jgi:hypothetical protein